MKAWWDSKALPWLKKYGAWIFVLPGLLLLAAKLLGGRKTRVVTSELLGAAEASNKADAKLEEQKAESSKKLDKELAEVAGGHEIEIDVMVAELNDAAADLLGGDAAELNVHLVDVGKDMRKP